MDIGLKACQGTFFEDTTNHFTDRVGSIPTTCIGLTDLIADRSIAHAPGNIGDRNVTYPLISDLDKPAKMSRALIAETRSTVLESLC